MRLESRVAELEQELGTPGFWDDQQHAAQVTAEHARLTRRLERYQPPRQRLRGRPASCSRMDGEMEDEIATQHRAAPRRARPPAGGRALHRRVRRRRRGRHDPRRRRRHRRAGLGRDAAAHVPALGRRAAASRPSCSRRARARRRASSRATFTRQRRERLRDPEGRARRAPARPAEPVRPGAPPAHELRAGDRRAAARPTTPTSRSTRATCGSTPTARAAPAAST